jgi:dolichol-phosphate mannosyltransferase
MSIKDTVSLIIPTYNEKDNIVPLIERIDRTLVGYNYEIVLVDDNSRDGTIEAAEGLVSRYPVKVVVRQGEKGLATAVVHGLQFATGGIIGVMDADLQHPPEVIPALIKALEDGADMAVASRYIPGGGCPSSPAPPQLAAGERPADRFLHVPAGKYRQGGTETGGV